MKKIISTCIALMVSAACSISAFAMEVPTNTTIQDLNGVRQYIKIYTVAPDTDPQSLIDDVFEYDGYTYTYSSMTKEERSYYLRCCPMCISMTLTGMWGAAIWSRTVNASTNATIPEG